MVAHKIAVFALIFIALSVQVETKEAVASPNGVEVPKKAPIMVVDNDLKGPIAHAVQQVLAGGRRRNGKSRRNRSPAQHYYKPLLRALKREDRRELKQIVLANITKAEIAEKVEKWVHDSEDSKTKEAFDLFKQERELMKKLKLIGEQNFLEDKSDEAKKLYYELKELKENQSITWDETCTRRNQLLYKSKHAVVEELRHKGRPCMRNDSYDQLKGKGGPKPKSDDE